MANLMRQAQEEDYRREQMAELERSSPTHYILRISECRWRLSVPVFSIRVTDGSTSSCRSAAMEGNWRCGCGKPVLIRARRGRCGCRPSIRLFGCFSLPGWGNNLNQIARKINGGQWSGADRVQVVVALMAIDAELERLRHSAAGKGVTMIVKFHPRGRGGVPPCDYLLGKTASYSHRPAGKAGGGPGAYRRLAPRQKTPPKCPSSLLNRIYRPASVKADGELLERVSDARTR